MFLRARYAYHWTYQWGDVLIISTRFGMALTAAPDAQGVQGLANHIEMPVLKHGYEIGVRRHPATVAQGQGGPVPYGRVGIGQERSIIHQPGQIQISVDRLSQAGHTGFARTRT